MSDNIMLDVEIRNWVLLPIITVMILQGFIRQYMSETLKDPPPILVDKLRNTALLRRSALLRANGQYLPREAFEMRRDFFVHNVFKPPPERKEGDTKAPEMPQQDPMAAMGMMKAQMGMIVPNMLMMGWCSYFFDGFVIAKLPFGLTQRFKAMFQKGIGLNSLEVSYISALSWYIVTAMGLRGIFAIVLGANNAADNAAMMKAQMGGMPPNNGMPTDFKPMFKNERNELEITNHSFKIREALRRILFL